MSSQDVVKEHRDLKRRLASARRRHEQEAPQAIAGDRNELVGQSLERRQELEEQLARSHWTRRGLPSAGTVVLLLVGAAALATAWHLREWRQGTAAETDPTAKRHLPAPMADPERTPAATYAKELLFQCRQKGLAALQDRWLGNLPPHLHEISAKSLAPFLSSPGLPVQVTAVEQRRNAVFVHVRAGEAVRLTLHLRESEPGRFALVTVE